LQFERQKVTKTTKIFDRQCDLKQLQKTKQQNNEKRDPNKLSREYLLDFLLVYVKNLIRNAILS